MELDQNQKGDRGLIVQEFRNGSHLPQFKTNHGRIIIGNEKFCNWGTYTKGTFLKPEDKKRATRYFLTEDLHKYKNIKSRELKLDKDKIMYILDVNRQSQNVFVLQYVCGSAGQFLSSCLSFADNVAKYLSKDKKIAIMKNIIAISHKINDWVDPINLSFDHFFGGVEKSINDNDPVFMLTHAGNPDSFFAEERMVLSTQEIINFFYNARVIEIINWVPMYCCRHTDFNMNMEEFLCLTTSEKKKFISTSINYAKGNHIFFPRYDRGDYGRSPDYTWDANDFFRLETFLSAMQKMYDHLGLTGFDSELLTWYYNEWYALVNSKKLEL